MPGDGNTTGYETEDPQEYEYQQDGQGYDSNGNPVMVQPGQKYRLVSSVLPHELLAPMNPPSFVKPAIPEGISLCVHLSSLSRLGWLFVCLFWFPCAFSALDPDGDLEEEWGLDSDWDLDSDWGCE